MSYETHLQRVDERKNALQKLLSEVLEGRTRVVLEIGCGHGHWLVDYASAFPDAFCLGIDIIGDRIARACKKQASRNLENVCFVVGEAWEVIEGLPPEIQLEKVFILFPDPWPKKRHWKNRLFQNPFLDRLAQSCASEAKLYFRTDHSGYMKWSKSIANENLNWEVSAKAEWPFERESVFQSKAEAFESLVLVRHSAES